jgi:hypothetical protein
MNKLALLPFLAALLIAVLIAGCKKEENQSDRSDIGTVLRTGRYGTFYKYTRQNGAARDSVTFNDTALHISVLSRVVVVLNALDLKDTLFVQSTTDNEIMLNNAKAADILGTMTIDLRTGAINYHKLRYTDANYQENWYLRFSR